MKVCHELDKILVEGKVVIAKLFEGIDGVVDIKLGEVDASSKVAMLVEERHSPSKIDCKS